MSITLHTDTGTLPVRDGYGQLLIEVAERAGLQLNTRCGGAGVCGGCTCKLSQGDYVVRDKHVTVEKEGYEVALACQTRVVSDEAHVHFPRTSIVEQAAQIDQDFALKPVRGKPLSRKVCVKVPRACVKEQTPDWNRLQTALSKTEDLCPLPAPLQVLQSLPQLLEAGGSRVTASLGLKNGRWTLLQLEAGDTSDANLGLAVDIGTTTVAAMLVDMNQGVVIAKASMYNQQISKADDVASRISYGASPERLQELQRLVVDETINALTLKLCREQGVQPEQILRLAVSANTVMSHLFLGLNPAGIGTLPFQPVTNEPADVFAHELALCIHPHAVVHVVPSIAGYVGGDITSDIHMAKLHKHPEPTLLLDIGTNGEMVYSEGPRMVACATAAGPAFEGYGITHGCRAAAGAVERVRFDARLQFTLEVIGGGKPTGLCGSGIIDFIAEGLRCGLINTMGRFNRDMMAEAGVLLEDLALCGPSMGCILADGDASGIDGPLWVSELDVSQLMKAKAAMYAGMKTLLESQGKRLRDIQRFCLAGGFARYINLENAQCMGLLPELPLERYEILGNGSLAGAFLSLVEAEAVEACKALIHVPEVLELNTDPRFESNFIDALALPNLDPDEFPQTNETLPCG